MSEKTYELMKSEFDEFLKNKAGFVIAGYCNARRNNSKKMILVCMILFSLALTLFFCALGIKTHAILFITASFVFSLILLWLNKWKSFNIVDAAQTKLKKSFMDQFLSIFFTEFSWQKSVPTFKSVFSLLREYKTLNILNKFFLVNFDDFISAKCNNLKFSIYSVDSRIFAVRHIPFYVFSFIFLFYTIQIFLIILFIISIFIYVLLNVFSFLIAGGLLLFCVVKFGIWIYKYRPFQGVFLEVELNKNLTGHTFFIENAPSSKAISVNMKNFSQVTLEASDFSGEYKVYSNNVEEVGDLLSTSFIDKLCNIKNAFNAKFIRGAFKDNKLVLMISCGRDVFDLGKNFKSADFTESAQLFDEMQSILKITEDLNI